jgi:hypothetical protein
MAVSSVDIERVVREVLAELALASREDRLATSVAAPQQTAVPASASKTAAPSPATTNGQLAIASRVVTLSEIGDRLTGIKRLVVPPGAVITPLVRDEIRRRGITLDFARAEEGSPTAARLTMVTVGQWFDPAPLVNMLRGEAVELDLHASDCLLATTDLIAQQVSPGDRLGAVLTSQPAIALCLLNRVPRLRAVTGPDAAEVAKAAASVGANVLVLRPHGAGLTPLRQMIREFCREGVRECPEALRERLG